MWNAIHSLFATADGRSRTKKSQIAQLLRLREGRFSVGPHIMIVALVAVDQDRWSLASTCCRKQWGVHFAETCEEASQAAHELQAPVILCDRDRLGSEWRSVISVLASLPHGGRVILVSSVVDDCLWEEVGRLGGHDVLSKPLREEPIIRAVTLAWSYWNSRAGKDPLSAKRP